MSFKVDYQNGQRFVDKLTPQLEKQIAKEYAGALKEIRATMAEFYAKYPMTYQEMAKYKRLEKLQAELKVIIFELNKRLEGIAEKGLEDIYTNAYNILGYALENNANFSWAMPPQRAIVEAINNPDNGYKVIDALKTNRNYVIDQVNQTVTRGLIRGDSYRDMAKQLQGTLEGNVNRYALRIVRTEAHKVQSIAQLDSTEYAESKGVKGKKVWVSTLDSRTRPDHQMMDGVEADDEGIFTLPDGSRGEAPGLLDNYAQNINCRCTYIYVIDEMPELRREKGGIREYRTYQEWAKEKQ